MQLSSSDYVLLAIVGIGAVYFLFKDKLFGESDGRRVGNGTGSTYGGATKSQVGPAGANGAGVGNGSAVGGAGRDLAKAMKLAARRCSLRIVGYA